MLFILNETILTLILKNMHEQNIINIYIYIRRFILLYIAEILTKNYV